MRTTALVVTLTLLLAVPARPADDPDAHPSAKKVISRAVGPVPIVRAAASAGISHLQNTPSEWGQGSVGYGRRVASKLGGSIVSTAIRYPVAWLMHEEFSYHRSNKQGFKARLMYALIATVWVKKTNSDKHVVSTSEISSCLGSGLISRLWQPASTRAISHGFVSAGIGLAADAGGNVLREFWPDIRHHGHKAKATPSTNAPALATPAPATP